MIWLKIDIAMMLISCGVAVWMVVHILSFRYCSVADEIFLMIFPLFMLGLGLQCLVRGMNDYHWNHAPRPRCQT